MKPSTDYHHVCASKPLCCCAGVDDECACMPKRMHRRVTRCIGCGAELRAIHVNTGVELKRGERNSYLPAPETPRA